MTLRPLDRVSPFQWHPASLTSSHANATYGCSSSKRRRPTQLANFTTPDRPPLHPSRNPTSRHPLPPPPTPGQPHRPNPKRPREHAHRRGHRPRRQPHTTSKRGRTRRRGRVSDLLGLGGDDVDFESYAGRGRGEGVEQYGTARGVLHGCASETLDASVVFLAMACGVPATITQLVRYPCDVA
jgi:hypothetical protein